MKIVESIVVGACLVGVAAGCSTEVNPDNDSVDSPCMQMVAHPPSLTDDYVLILHPGAALRTSMSDQTPPISTLGTSPAECLVFPTKERPPKYKKDGKFYWIEVLSPSLKELLLGPAPDGVRTGRHSYDEKTFPERAWDLYVSATDASLFCKKGATYVDCTQKPIND